MPLIKPLEILKKAKLKKIGVPAFNVMTLETTQGIIDAAEELNRPVILQVSSNALEWSKFEYIIPMLISVAKSSKVDVALHLDHFTDINMIEKCVEAGFTSIMYDGSRFDIQKNIENSKKIINNFKDKVNIELEIGYVGGKEGDKDTAKKNIIKSEDIINFYNELKPDMLAFSFGTSHGLYKGAVKLDFNLVEICSNEISAPLVMHGSSGVPFDDIKKCIKSGITKINIGTDVLIAYHGAIQKFMLKNPSIYDIRKINSVGIKAVKERAIEYFKLLETE